MSKYTEAAQAVYSETRTALQTVFDALNKGQQQKVMKNEDVAELFARYKIDTGSTE